MRTDLTSPPMLFPYKWAALVKPLLVWAAWTGACCVPAGLRQQGQQLLAGRSMMELCCLCTLCLGTHSHHTNWFWITCHPHSAKSPVSLTCLCLAHALQGKELSCTAFLGIQLLWWGTKNLLIVLGGKHKIPERITHIVWRTGTKCILSVFADWVVCKILIYSSVLISFFIYLKATQVVQHSGWLDRRNSNYWIYRDFWSILFPIVFLSSNYKWGAVHSCIQLVLLPEGRYTVKRHWPNSTHLKGKGLINLHGFHQHMKQLYLGWAMFSFSF